MLFTPSSCILFNPSYVSFLVGWGLNSSLTGGTIYMFDGVCYAWFRLKVCHFVWVFIVFNECENSRA